MDDYTARRQVSAAHGVLQGSVTELRSGATLPNPLSLAPGAVSILDLGPPDFWPGSR